jgi:hypothetical protein
MKKKNLRKLAKGLLTVPEEQFEMNVYTSVENPEEFARRHPKITSKMIDDFPQDFSEIDDLRGECLTPRFKIEHGCGTSGCALGWAPALVKRGREGEDYPDYSERVFDLRTGSATWAFMFMGKWKGANNTPKKTAERIMYVVENGGPPESFVKCFLDWRMEWDYEESWSPEQEKAA